MLVAVLCLNAIARFRGGAGTLQIARALALQISSVMWFILRMALVPCFCFGISASFAIGLQTSGLPFVKLVGFNW